MEFCIVANPTDDADAMDTAQDNFRNMIKKDRDRRVMSEMG